LESIGCELPVDVVLWGIERCASILGGEDERKSIPKGVSSSGELLDEVNMEGRISGDDNIFDGLGQVEAF
jgi:hypothetical protein